mmetsp:Transcript_12467/g.13816  ORF Transcript_12467/g.13816 Transcript_12467/m.13816 type:complete len:88 (+) Transcript_12467:235-498(+)
MNLVCIMAQALDQALDQGKTTPVEIEPPLRPLVVKNPQEIMLCMRFIQKVAKYCHVQLGLCYGQICVTDKNHPAYGSFLKTSIQKYL